MIKRRPNFLKYRAESKNLGVESLTDLEFWQKYNYQKYLEIVYATNRKTKNGIRDI